jgi:hypothetical protein
MARSPPGQDTHLHPPTTTVAHAAPVSGPPLPHPHPLPISWFLVAESDSPHHRVQRTCIDDSAWVAGRVQVEVGNRITRWMTRMPSGEICGGEPKPNSLGLGFAVSSVGDGGSSLWYGVASRSPIMRSVIPLVRGSTAGDPLSCSSVAGVLISTATVNGVMPSGGPANHPRSTCDIGV